MSASALSKNGADTEGDFHDAARTKQQASDWTASRVRIASFPGDLTKGPGANGEASATGASVVQTPAVRSVSSRRGDSPRLRRTPPGFELSPAPPRTAAMPTEDRRPLRHWKREQMRMGRPSANAGRVEPGAIRRRASAGEIGRAHV